MKCIVLSTPYIIDLFIFYILITSIWTLVGYKLISDLDGEVEYDEYLNNFDDYLRALNAMYVLISFDGYPDIMLSALSNKYLRNIFLKLIIKLYAEQSYAYLIFFVPYIMAFLIIFIPIPVAIIFENFKVD